MLIVKRGPGEGGSGPGGSRGGPGGSRGGPGGSRGVPGRSRGPDPSACRRSSELRGHPKQKVSIVRFWRSFGPSGAQTEMDRNVVKLVRYSKSNKYIKIGVKINVKTCEISIN